MVAKYQFRIVRLLNIRCSTNGPGCVIDPFGGVFQWKIKRTPQIWGVQIPSLTQTIFNCLQQLGFGADMGMLLFSFQQKETEASSLKPRLQVQMGLYTLGRFVVFLCFVLCLFA